MENNFNFEKIEAKENPIKDFEVDSICEKAEKIITKERELGVGKSADVYLEDFQEGNLAYKIVRDIVFQFQNNVKTEAELMIKAKDLAGDDVIIPTPYARLFYKNDSKKFYKDKKDLEVLVMKAIDGVTVQEALEDHAFISQIDINDFRSRLKRFVEKMHENNLYHRDMHDRNIMIDRETLKPVVIDFGVSVIAFGEDKPYHEKVFRDFGRGFKEPGEHKLPDDMFEIDKVCMEIQNKIASLQN